MRRSKRKQAPGSETVGTSSERTDFAEQAKCTKPSASVLLRRDFYATPCATLARELLGKKLVRQIEDGMTMVGKIVEVEAYLGKDDKGSHSYRGKCTERNKSMFMPPGTAYVYTIYGIHHCFNISSEGDGAAVLIRAVEPLEGLEIMRQRRGLKRKDGGAGIKDWELCSGPANLCQAMNICKDLFDGKTLTSNSDSSGLWLEMSDDICTLNDWVISTSRVGIDYAGPEWASKPLRFYLMTSRSVSVRDKAVEAAVTRQFSR